MITKADHYDLYKWAVALRSSSDSPWQTLSLQKVVSAQLLSLIEEQGVRKFLLYSGGIETAKDALFVSFSLRTGLC